LKLLRCFETTGGDKKDIPSIKNNRPTYPENSVLEKVPKEKKPGQNDKAMHSAIQKMTKRTKEVNYDHLCKSFLQ